MRIPFFQKLFISLLLSSISLLIAMALLINTSFKEGFQQYLNESELAKAQQLAERVTSYYSDKYQWQRLSQAPHIWANLLQQLGEMPPPPRKARPPKSELISNSEAKPNTLFVPLGSRINLLTLDGISVLGPPENLASNDKFIIERIAITQDDTTIGWISVQQSPQLSNALAERFLYSQSKHILTITAVTLLLTLLVSYLLVSYLLKPLKALLQGAHAVQKGDLNHRVNHRGNDEIGDLINAFNHLVATLKKQQQLRQQWLSDISHELRTPLAVLRSEIEAIQDGIRKPDVQHIDSLHHQVTTLTKLVEDLHSLTLSDTIKQIIVQPSAIDISQTLSPITNSYALRLEEKQISLHCNFNINEPVHLRYDVKTLQQLITNLLENSYRYTDEQGRVTFTIEQQDNHLIFCIEDSSPSVPDNSLSKLFDRLYRVDKSRSRTKGGSGLGLSICQNIVTSQGGKIVASHSSLGGLKISVSLPVVLAK